MQLVTTQACHIYTLPSIDQLCCLRILLVNCVFNLQEHVAGGEVFAQLMASRKGHFSNVCSALSLLDGM